MGSINAFKPGEKSPLPCVLMAASGLLLAACAATVRPPPEPDAPRAVFLLDHGRHTSLVLARDDDGLVRYVYGEWRWYAEMDTGFLRTFPVLFKHTPAALGRRELAGPPEPDQVRAQIKVVIRELHDFQAEADRVDALIGDLDAQFDAHRETLHYNSVYDLEFVHHPIPYRLGHNSNHLAGQWLKQLGFEIRGNPVFGRWRVED